MSKSRKCKGCNIYYPKESFEIIKPWNNFHTVKCLQDWLERKRIEEQKKAYMKLLREKKPRRTALQKARDNAVYYCHAYIRERDKDKPCISCQTPVTDEPHAGHFIASTCSYLKFHEMNIHKQCCKCNTFLRGNLLEYRKHLIKKIGIDAVEWLEACKHKSTKRTVADYRQITNMYKEKLKKLQEK